VLCACSASGSERPFRFPGPIYESVGGRGGLSQFVRCGSAASRRWVARNVRDCDSDCGGLVVLIGPDQVARAMAAPRVLACDDVPTEPVGAANTACTSLASWVRAESRARRPRYQDRGHRKCAARAAHGKLDQLRVGKKRELAGRNGLSGEIGNSSGVHAVADCPLVVRPPRFGLWRPSGGFAQ
jgi:hypothetical protein